MGQKVSPIGLRLGIIKSWSSNWYAAGDNYIQWLHEDIKIRETLLKRFKKAAISKVDIERTEKIVHVYIHSARPGVVLGTKGANIEIIKKMLQKALKNKRLNLKINVVPIKNPSVDAQIIANTIAEQIVNRASFRTVQKIAIRRALEAGAKGIKTSVAGRLGGVDMARTEGYLEGTVPLATLRQDIDYAFAEALTTYGQIGVKVWVSHGEILPGESKREQRKQSEYLYRLANRNENQKKNLPPKKLTKTEDVNNVNAEKN